MDRLNNSARHIRKLMREAEHITDENMVACSKLKTAMVEARLHSPDFVGVGQNAILRLAQAEQQLVSASSNLLRVHAELNSIAQTTANVDQDIVTKETALGVIPATNDLPRPETLEIA